MLYAIQTLFYCYGCDAWQGDLPESPQRFAAFVLMRSIAMPEGLHLYVFGQFARRHEKYYLLPLYNSLGTFC